MTKVVLSRLFVSKLKDILDYIELDNSKEVANKIEHNIMEAIELLQLFPNYGQKVVNKRGKFKLHVLIVGYYRIIYSVSKEGVFVEDIVDSRMYHRLPQS